MATRVISTQPHRRRCICVRDYLYLLVSTKKGLLMEIVRLSQRARRIAREHGVAALLVRTWRFCHDALGSTFCFERVYVCRFGLADLDSWPRPSLDDGFTTRFIASNEDADHLADRGYEDPRDSFLRMRASLDTGAVALCAYRGTTLAHIGWVARTPVQKSRFDDVPYPVDFGWEEACLGSVFTFPEYRGKGLAPYSMRLRLEYLRSVGCHACLVAIGMDNQSSLRAITRVGPLTRRAALHVKLPGINYMRYIGLVEPVEQSSVGRGDSSAQVERLDGTPAIN